MRAVRWALLIVVGMALTISTAMRVHVFQDERVLKHMDALVLKHMDERVLWQDAITKAPLKPRPWVNLGRQFALHGSDPLAVYAYETAITLAEAPGRTHEERVIAVAFAHANLGVILRTRDRTRAMHHFAMAEQTMPNTPAILRVALWTGDLVAR